MLDKTSLADLCKQGMDEQRGRRLVIMPGPILTVMRHHRHKIAITAARQLSADLEAAYPFIFNKP